MAKDFYTKKFDDATNVKLEIFRGYTREWLSVFMTKRTVGYSPIRQINIYDFFAGCGQDSAGNPGSPLIIVDEIKKYCQTNDSVKADIPVRLVFNDLDSTFITKLQNSVSNVACNKSCCKIEYNTLSFEEAFSHYITDISSDSSASLIIMDQFGVKEVTPDVVQKLAACSKTDILFFISTSFIKRFIETPEIRSKFDLDTDEMKNIEYYTIHRYICDYYREQLTSPAYYLSPFSIKKGSNIYGVIFGSSNLYGLEKFLNVCWKLDSVTGEANYNIDRDFSWGGLRSLFPESNLIKKIERFKKELADYIASNNPDNIALNKFCLVKGFSPAKAGEVLRDLQKDKKILVFDIENQKPARKSSFYLGWNNCKPNTAAKARFSMEATS